MSRKEIHEKKSIYKNESRTVSRYVAQFETTIQTPKNSWN